MRQTAQSTEFTLSSLNEATPMVLAQDFRHIGFNIDADDTASYTITAYASNQWERPDLTSAVSSTNQYSTVQVKDLVDNASIDGGTGIVISADGFTRYEVNDNNARWIGLKVTAYTSGTLTAQFLLSTNV